MTSPAPASVVPPAEGLRGDGPTRRAGGRIGEIDGLRGLALTLVVLFHLFGAGRVSGGVDVFLTLSGFLATRALLSRAGSGRLQLAAHYGRTLARLAPPALVVLLAVTAGTVLLLSPARWPEVLREVGASATFRENWQLIGGQLAYGAAGPDASPLQHFWSLSVQGQFFAVWPPVVLLCVVVAERRARRSRTRLTPARALGLVAGAATVASFAYAQWLVTVDQPIAYFSTWSRFWELGAGVLLALALGRLQMAPALVDGRVRAVLGWTGLALIVGCGFAVDGARAFPGPWTLLPVGGALLVVLGSGDGSGTGAGAGSRWSPARALEGRALRWVADVSYALYLWHWPVLVLWLAASGETTVGPAGGALVLAVSVVLAWVTTRFVADPVLRRIRGDGPVPAGTRPRRPARGVRTLAVLATASLLVSAGATGAASAHDERLERERHALLAPSADHPGAAVLAPGGPVPAAGVAIRPATYLAAKDRPHLDDCAQGGIQDDSVVSCVVATPHTTPTARVLVVGASHEQQWLGPLVRVADGAGWEVTVMIKHGCRLSLSGEAGMNYPPACASWNRQVVDRVVAERPDAVVVVGTRTFEDGRAETVLPGQTAAWRELDAAGVPVVALRDNPRFAWRVPDCLDRHGADEPERTADAVVACSRQRAGQLADVSPLLSTPGVPSSTVEVDLTDHLCGPVVCEPVVGNVLAYRDDDHLTGTFTETLAPALGAALRDRAPWLFPAG
ncbi:acyltransferase family protein [Antribacter gilvus]|uniref:acyltransferase family protein n=1 Tax=Antribacter gilvus TaxID=2304675 RepID=UPI000F7ADE05|nr:acyltransferase family protein [Antribacter gilvus]